MEGFLRLESSALAYKIIDQDDAEQLYSIYPDLPKSHLYGCPSCGKNRGPMVDGELILNGLHVQCNCQDQLQRHKHYLNSGIGLTYQVLSWSDFKGDQNAKRQVDTCLGNLLDDIEIGVGMFIHGSGYGTGKTMLAYLSLKEFVLRGYKCYATTYGDMLASMKAGWRDDKYARWYKSKIDSAQVLVIDDVGKELMQTSGFNNDFSRQTLDGLIRTRAQQSKPTIITTNIGKADVKTYYGSAVASLIDECMNPIRVEGDDYRKLVCVKKKGERRIF